MKKGTKIPKLEQFDFSGILDNTDISVNEANLSKFRQYLISNLKEPVYLTGVEDFPWEERFFFGYGSEKEHAQLRQSNPSYKDTFKLLKILDADTYESDLFAKVRRESDGKTFEIMLSWLEATDEDSENYALLQTFSIWIVNY